VLLKREPIVDLNYPYGESAIRRETFYALELLPKASLIYNLMVTDLGRAQQVANDLAKSLIPKVGADAAAWVGIAIADVRHQADVAFAKERASAVNEIAAALLQVYQQNADPTAAIQQAQAVIQSNLKGMGVSAAEASAMIAEGTKKAQLAYLAGRPVVEPPKPTPATAPPPPLPPTVDVNALSSKAVEIYTLSLTDAAGAAKGRLDLINLLVSKSSPLGPMTKAAATTLVDQMLAQAKNTYLAAQDKALAQARADEQARLDAQRAPVDQGPKGWQLQADIQAREQARMQQQAQAQADAQAQYEAQQQAAQAAAAAASPAKPVEAGMFGSMPPWLPIAGIALLFLTGKSSTARRNPRRRHAS